MIEKFKRFVSKIKSNGSNDSSDSNNDANIFFDLNSANAKEDVDSSSIQIVSQNKGKSYLIEFVKSFFAAKKEDDNFPKTEEEIIELFKQYRLTQEKMHDFVKETTKHSNVNFFYFYGKVVPEDDGFYSYLDRVLPRLAYPNTSDNYIHISLEALSHIWRTHPKRGSKIFANEKATQDAVIKAIANHVEKLKTHFIPDMIKQINKTAVDELESIINPSQESDVEDKETAIDEEVSQEIPRETSKETSQDNKDNVQVQSDTLEDTSTIDTASNQEGVDNDKNNQNVSDSSIVLDQQHQISTDVPEAETQVDKEQTLYQAKTPEQFTELFIQLVKSPDFNPENYLKLYAKNEEILLLYEALSKFSFGNLYLPVVYGLFLLDCFGNDTSSVLVKEEKIEPAEFHKYFITDKQTATLLLAHISLLPHTVNQVWYALKDLPPKVEAGVISKNDIPIVLAAVLLHDIGKIFVYRAENKKLVREHAEYGAFLLEQLFSLPTSFTRLIREHHVLTSSKKLTVNQQEDVLLRLVRMYDRTERQMELQVLSPVSIHLQDTGAFDERDLQYLREWCAKNGKRLQLNTKTEGRLPSPTLSSSQSKSVSSSEVKPSNNTNQTSNTSQTSAKGNVKKASDVQAELLEKVKSFISENNVSCNKIKMYCVFNAEDLREIENDLKRLNIYLEGQAKKGWIVFKPDSVLIHSNLLES